MKKILVTTTETLQGYDIVSYIKPIFSNLVVGANFFKDFGASFSDFFGGRSTLYERNLHLLNEQAMQTLIVKAKEIGANCVLGMKVDVDEISGKNMQMFMVTAWGTAVIAVKSGDTRLQENFKEVDKESIKEKARLLVLINESAKEGFKLTLKDLEFIVETKSPEFRHLLINKYKRLDPANFDDAQYKSIVALYQDYFATLDANLAVPIVYDALLKETDKKAIDKITELIKANDLLDYAYINLLLAGDRDRRLIALNLLTGDKKTYVTNDINELKNIKEQLASALPIQTTRGTKKGFLSSNEKEVWICSCNTSNPLDQQYCSNCNKDEYGFKPGEVSVTAVLPMLENKIQALSSLL
ncbi:YbjQ family protein [Mucilaginibacter pallidiroseus]|uniref:UPF0145 protein FPZ43_05295 n=1 Tax=Mucilaginibacter pallidiroseus TaxID=2599295 RepID=A0A563UG81_9SPHI|nr:YbjQ family protein [Mucilaginibacter pallidiroseus]TWR30358.1 YbjQ family protein [Mucilaginibacter pallidiroseus]